MDKELKIILEKMFLKEATTSIALLFSALEEKNFQIMSNITHKLKGQVLLLSLEDLTLACYKLEHEIEFKNLIEIKEKLNNLQSEFNLFKSNVTQ
ncbi:MAG: Hpt domain-containing protein [Vicingaceae bacterium]